MPIHDPVVRWVAALLVGLAPGFAIAGETNLGAPLSASELAPFSITVFPDGMNLPKGQGTVREGYDLYEEQCANCHGATGTEGPAARLADSDGWYSLRDPLRILRIRHYPVLLVSAGGMWPHATTLYDYIRRAMPHYAPKSLTSDETYALTAYLLYLNGLSDWGKTLDRDTILDVEMPGKPRGVSAWPIE